MIITMIWFDGSSGRAFNIGKIKGVDVVYVMSGEKTVSFLIAVSLFQVCGHLCTREQKP